MTRITNICLVSAFDECLWVRVVAGNVIRGTGYIYASASGGLEGHLGTFIRFHTPVWGYGTEWLETLTDETAQQVLAECDDATRTKYESSTGSAA